MSELVKIKCPTCHKNGRYGIKRFQEIVECKECKQNIKITIEDKYDIVYTDKIIKLDKINPVFYSECEAYNFYDKNKPLEMLDWINQYKAVVSFQYMETTQSLYFKTKGDEEILLMHGYKITFNGKEFIVDNSPDKNRGGINGKNAKKK